MKIERPSREALIRYYRGECLPNEETLVVLYLSMDLDHDFTESCLREAWSDLNDAPTKISSVGQRKAAWKKFQLRKIKATQISAKRTVKWYGYAASITLFLFGALALGYLVTDRSQKGGLDHYSAAIGERKEIRLRDSSTVMLFPGSSLDVPENFNGKDRKVVLKGRAFFKVAHNREKPFLVKSGKLSTEVLGTSFEVNASDVASSTITLHSGKVGIRHSGNEIARLVPNQRITYDTRVNKFKIDNVEAAETVLWIDGELTYDLVPLAVICQDLEKWYKVKIDIRNTELLRKKITTSFKDLSVSQVLDMLSVTTGLTYTVKGNHIIIN